MKKINVLQFTVVALLFFMACEKKVEGVKIEGDIENPTQKELYIGTQNGAKIDTIKIDDNGHFSSIVNKNSGYALIAYNNEFAPIYLGKGDLKIKASSDNFNKSLEYTGGSLKEDNIFLKEHAGDYEKVLKKYSVDKVFSLPEGDFINLLDSIQNDYNETLKASKVSKSFMEDEKKRMFYNFYYWYLVYPDNYKIFAKDEDYQPSENFKNKKGTITYDNNNDYEKIPNYRTLVREYYLNLIDSAKNNKQEMDKLLKDIKNSQVKDLAVDISYHFIPNVKDSEEELLQKKESIHYLTNDKRVISLLDKKLEGLSKLSQGMVSPNFSYQDINNKTISLSDFKGKLLYIDVWATWCGPCRAELPSLKKLEEHYKGKNIEFISISIDEKKDIWEKFVKKNNLQGIQLYANKASGIDFVKDYKINGIPRFILIDKKGKIISANAPRPSDEKVYSLIDEWLNKK